MDPNRFWRATGKRVGSSSVHPLYQWNARAGGEQTICLCWWLHISGSCSQASNRPAVAASQNRDLARIQEWCNHWCIILNPYKTMALVVSRSRTANPPHGDLVLSGMSICVSPNLDILGVKFDSRLTFEDFARGIVSRVSQITGILRSVKHVCADTSMLLRSYHAFSPNPSILEYCSPVWGSAAECDLKPLEHQVYSVAMLCPHQTFLSLCHRRNVAALCMLYKVNSNSNHWKHREHLLPLFVQCASICFCHSSTLPSCSHWSLMYQGVERPNLQGASCRPKLVCGMTFSTLCLTREC